MCDDMAFFTRKIKCKKCGFSGEIEAQDTQYYPPQKIFKQLGKDVKGYLHFQCPSCKTDEPYSPYTFFNPVVKIGCLIFLVFFAWIIIKVIF